MCFYQVVLVVQFIGVCDYVECCVKICWNVKEVFKSVVDVIFYKDDKEDGKLLEEINKFQFVFCRFLWFIWRFLLGFVDFSDCNIVVCLVLGSR